jgi:hypothetical protein
MTVQNLIWTVIRFRFEELIFVDIVLGWSDAHAPPFRVWPLRNPKVATVFRLSSQDMKGTFLDMSTIIAPASCLWRSSMCIVLRQTLPDWFSANNVFSQNTMSSHVRNTKKIFCDPNTHETDLILYLPGPAQLLLLADRKQRIEKSYQQLDLNFKVLVTVNLSANWIPGSFSAPTASFRWEWHV